MLSALGFACVVIDGIFGAHTEDALRKFQLNLGLPSDGIAGAYTYAAIQNLHHSWVGKAAIHEIVHLGFARAADVLEQRALCLFGTEEFACSVASRMSNLSLATNPQSMILSADSLVVAPDESMLLVHIVLPEEEAVQKVPRVCYEDEATLPLRLEQALVAAKVGGRVTCHPYYGAPYFGRRVEYVFADGEQIFYLIPCLYQYAEDTVSFAARSGGNTFGYFLLDHARTTGDNILVIQHFKEYLTGDIIRVITCQYERLAVEQPVEIHFQEVIFNDVVFQRRIFFTQIGYGLIIQFHHLHRTFFSHQKLGQYTHARTYFQNGEAGTCVYRIGYILCHFQIFQKMLAEKLFRLY